MPLDLVAPVLRPSLSTQRVVEDLADAVVAIFVEQIARNMAGVRVFYTHRRRRSLAMLGTIDVTDALTRVDLTGHRQAALLADKLASTIIQTAWRKDKTVACYRRPFGSRPATITLFFKPETLDIFASSYERGDLTQDNVTLFRLPALRSTLVHELTHACDQIMSSGKFEMNSRSIARRLAKLKGEDDSRYYRRDPVEIHAYCAEALAAGSREFGNDGCTLRAFIDFVLLYLDDCVGMSKLQRRSVIRQASRYWHEMDGRPKANTTTHPVRITA